MRKGVEIGESRLIRVEEMNKGKEKNIQTKEIAGRTGERVSRETGEKLC